MRLKRLFLENFRNYKSASLSLEGNVHCLVGKNGSGKTNVLESIHYLSVTKGAFNSHDSANIKSGEDHFVIKGEFENNGLATEVLCRFDGKKKKMSENGNECQRLSHHVGKFPMVMIAPYDISNIWEVGESRRRLFDSFLCQAERRYMEDLLNYNHLVKQRNSLLRQSPVFSTLDADLLDSYHENMAPLARSIHHFRKSFVENIVPILQRNYEFLADRYDENVNVLYHSDLQKHEVPLVWKRNVEADRLLGRTSLGVHRDNYDFKLNGSEIREYGSQGQQKTFLIALKFAEYELLKAVKGRNPVLLLDDIFDKLDVVRMEKLIELIRNGKFGQLFITDARPEMAKKIISSSNIEAEFFLIENGSIKRD